MAGMYIHVYIRAIPVVLCLNVAMRVATVPGDTDAIRNHYISPRLFVYRTVYSNIHSILSRN